MTRRKVRPNKEGESWSGKQSINDLQPEPVPENDGKTGNCVIVKKKRKK